MRFADGRFRHVPGDLARRRGLLFDGAGDRVLDVIDLVDDLADLADCFDRTLGVVLDRFDLAADVLGRFGGLLGKLFDLVGDDAETFACFAGAGNEYAATITFPASCTAGIITAANGKARLLST